MSASGPTWCEVTGQHQPAAGCERRRHCTMMMTAGAPRSRFKRRADCIWKSSASKIQAEGK